MSNIAQTLEELNAAGGQGFDPVRFQFISALVRKAEQLPEHVATPLLDKARTAIERLSHDLKNKQHSQETDGHDSKKAPPTRPLALLSELTQELSQRSDEDHNPAGERTLSDFIQQQEKTLLLSLTSKTDQNSGQNAVTHTKHRELKSLAPFRKSWEKVRADRVAIEVGQEAPENPGPLNQHMLVISTLTKMQQLSPTYFKRYISYMESLMWVEDAGKSHKGKTKRKPANKSASKQEVD